MTDITQIATILQQDCPSYKFHICRGLFERYIAVEVEGRISFTIWIDKRSGHKELLDEVNFMPYSGFNNLFKTRLFHWTKYRRLPRNNDFIGGAIKEMELARWRRQKIRNNLESSLQKMHIANNPL
jgi:hypothetical protein